MITVRICSNNKLEENVLHISACEHALLSQCSSFTKYELSDCCMKIKGQSISWYKDEPSSESKALYIVCKYLLNEWLKKNSDDYQGIR